MVPNPPSGLEPLGEQAINDWPWLGEAVLRSSRSRQIRLTCHVFRHHPGVNGIPQPPVISA